MATTTFLDWCQRHGIQRFGIVAAEVTEGERGLVATRQIHAGDLVLKVPGELLMSTQSARRDPDLRGLLSRGAQELTPTQVLTVHLLREMSKVMCSGARGSFWGPYLSQLPREYQDLRHFSAHEADLMQFPWGLQAFQASMQEAEVAWGRCRNALRQLRLGTKWRSRKAWWWATSTLSSRTMFVPWDSAGALTPLGDLLNYRHPTPPFTPLELLGARHLVSDLPGGQEWGDGVYDKDAAEYHLFARSDYQPGEQVFMCYGAHTNLQLLEHYGFVLWDNPHDIVPLQRSSLELNDGESMSAAECYIHSNGAPSWGVLRAMRLHFGRHSTLNAQRALAGEPIAAAEERLVMEKIVQLCQQTLDSVETSLAEDEELLLQQTDAGGCCGTLALRWRMSQKKILVRCINVAQEHLNTLE
eukprot:evm.model.scf_2881.1 EVM.evm.TU.scf_2881.1   scf_2881:1985-3226(+)